MAQQPDLFPPNPRNPGPGAQPGRGSSASPQRVHWMARVEAIIRVVVRLYLGLLVLALPWLPFWTENNLFTYSPLLFTLATNGFVRGLFSGLGLLNVILAVLEAKHARALV
jgi:formate-dependent nitrite reductase membrane component NrfD